MIGQGVNVGGVYYEVDLETGNLIRQGRQAERAVGSVERAFTRVAGAVASLVAAMSIEAVVRTSINASRRFEKAIADLSAITGATGDDLRRLTEEAKALGSTTTASAGQVVEAMKLIASAKPELLETSGALGAVTKEAIALADASGMALPAAAEAVTLALNQFGAGADQASRFVNVLAAGAKFGASEIADTAVALKNSAVSAAAAGVSFETTNAALQALAAGGIKGGEAGTALRNVILKLENDANTKLKPSLNGLVGALENLNRQNLSSTELTKLFGLENVNAAQALLGSADKVRELTAQLTGTQTAYEQAAVNTGTFDAQLKLMNNSLELAAIKLGDELKPAAEAGARAIQQIAQAFIDGAPAITALGTALQVAALHV
jgi:TP901 family phage tail tape measure protein